MDGSGSGLWREEVEYVITTEVCGVKSLYIMEVSVGGVSGVDGSGSDLYMMKGRGGISGNHKDRWSK